VYGQWLVDSAQIPEGATALDVACGRGAVLFPAAERVGAGGKVIGIDLAEGMARETGLEIQKRGLAQAETRQMDAETLDFPASFFDVVLCGFSLQFFPHLDRALGEFHRVLKPNGRLAVTTWSDTDDPRWNWYDELRTAYQANVRLRSNSLNRPEAVEKWFTEAGFKDIQIITKDLDMVFRDEDEWWNVEWSLSGRAGLEELNPEELSRFKAECFTRMQAQREADGFHFQLSAFCTTAKKP
jgi:ubiquinone/menaquinone biosynthesis C-methylase UbiE